MTTRNSIIGQTFDGIPIPIEQVKELQKRSFKLLEIDQPQTESVPFPTPTDITSDLFEYDITGIRVKGIGQATGGFLREVAENESALAFSLQDDACLFILHRIASADNSIELRLLDEIIYDSNGWMRFCTLYKAGLLELLGSQVRVTDRGFKELNMIEHFCRLFEHVDL